MKKSIQSPLVLLLLVILLQLVANVLRAQMQATAQATAAQALNMTAALESDLIEKVLQIYPEAEGDCTKVNEIMSRADSLVTARQGQVQYRWLHLWLISRLSHHCGLPMQDELRRKAAQQWKAAQAAVPQPSTLAQQKVPVNSQSVGWLAAMEALVRATRYEFELAKSASSRALESNADEPFFVLTKAEVLAQEARVKGEMTIAKEAASYFLKLPGSELPAAIRALADLSAARNGLIAKDEGAALQGYFGYLAKEKKNQKAYIEYAEALLKADDCNTARSMAEKAVELKRTPASEAVFDSADRCLRIKTKSSAPAVSATPTGAAQPAVTTPVTPPAGAPPRAADPSPITGSQSAQ
jgi:hypothetical protein